MRCIYQPANDALNQVLQERGESEALLVKVTRETRKNWSLFNFSVYPSLQSITGYLSFQPEQFIMDLVSLFVKSYKSYKGEERAASLPQILHLRPEGCRGIHSTPSYFCLPQFLIVYRLYLQVVWNMGMLIKSYPPEASTIKNIEDSWALLKTEDGQKRWSACQWEVLVS